MKKTCSSPAAVESRCPYADKTEKYRFGARGDNWGAAGADLALDPWDRFIPRVVKVFVSEDSDL